MKRVLCVWAVVLVLLCSFAAVVCAQEARETEAQKNARMKWWREAKFGMFIHWGLYAVPAGVWDGKQIPGIGEWIMNSARIPVSDYEKLAQSFNPVKFDADAWVRAAKDAGMKYIVITSKHHDGFAIFHSAATTFNIYDATPFKRDPIKELAAACKKHKIRLGFYYSQAQDWHHPGGGSFSGPWDERQKGDLDKYVQEIAIPQVRELLTNYGKISILWWDTPLGMSPKSVRDLAALTKLQPGIITNDRLGNGIPGDTATPEQTIPSTGMGGRDWETCMTINDTWGYKSYDNNWKSSQTLIRNLIDIASKGGNYLLNVGPTAEGVFPEPIVVRLKEIGKWMKTNGEAVYGSSPSPFRKQFNWGRCTSKGKKLYISVFDWPKDNKILVPVNNDISKAYMLAARKSRLKWTRDQQGVHIQLPQTAPDKIASVVVLETKGNPDILDAVNTVKQGASAELLAEDAFLHGSHIFIEKIGDAANIGYWIDPNDYAEWKLAFEKAETYAVELEYSMPVGCGEGGADIEIGNSRLHIQPEPTAAWDSFTRKSFGNIEVKSAGKTSVIVRSRTKNEVPLMNLRRIILKPVD